MKKLSRNAIIGYPAGIISGIAYGLNPLFAKPLMSNGAAVESILFFRYLFAVVMLGAFLWISSRSFKVSVKQAAVLRAQGEAEAIETVFEAIHRGNPDEKLLAYQYLQTLPKIADGASNKMWIIPSEFTEALKGVSGAFGSKTTDAAARGPRPTSL